MYVGLRFKLYGNGAGGSVEGKAFVALLVLEIVLFALNIGIHVGTLTEFGAGDVHEFTKLANYGLVGSLSCGHENLDSALGALTKLKVLFCFFQAARVAFIGLRVEFNFVGFLDRIVI